MPDGGLRAKNRRFVPISDTRPVPPIEHIIKKFASVWGIPRSAVRAFVEDTLSTYHKVIQNPGSTCQYAGQREGTPEPDASPSVSHIESGMLATYKPFGNRTLPELPPGLHWPTETYSGSPEAKNSRSQEAGGIVAFLDRVWLPLLIAGVATRRILEIVDPSAITAIANFTKTNPRTAERRELPSRLHFPTLKEINDTLLASAPDIARVAANRRATARQSRGLKQAAE
jgi:hypothetical protein